MSAGRLALRRFLRCCEAVLSNSSGCRGCGMVCSPYCAWPATSESAVPNASGPTRTHPSDLTSRELSPTRTMTRVSVQSHQPATTTTVARAGSARIDSLYRPEQRLLEKPCNDIRWRLCGWLGPPTRASPMCSAAIWIKPWSDSLWSGRALMCGHTCLQPWNNG